MDLRYRFTFFFSFLSLACLLCFSVLVYTQIRNRLLANAEAQLIAHLEHDADHLGHEHSNVHPNPSREPAHSVALRIWKNGKLIEDSFPKGVEMTESTPSQRTPQSLVHRLELTKGGNRFVLLGHYDLTPTLSYLRTLKRVLLLGCLLALALIIPVSLLSTRFLLKPFRELSLDASQLNAEKLSFRFEEPKQRDEFGTLVRSFNALLTRLEKSFGEINRFATNASHELRTPVAVILGQAEMALRRPRESAEYREALEKVQEKAHHLQGIIHRLLTVAELERMEPAQIQPIELSKYVEEVKASLSYSHAPDGKTVDTSGVDPSSVFQGNLEIFLSILTNLLENAVKYSKSRVEVFAKAEESGLKLYVDDDGPGIPKSWREHAFEPFSRTGEKKVHGTGLGLSIVRACIDSCQGTIALKDSPLGGLRVEVNLPSPRGTTA